MTTTTTTAPSHDLHPLLAGRVLGAKPSATKEMTRLANQLKREGRNVIAPVSYTHLTLPTKA